MTRKFRMRCFAGILLFLCCLSGFAARVEPRAAGAEEKKPQHVLAEQLETKLLEELRQIENAKAAASGIDRSSLSQAESGIRSRIRILRLGQGVPDAQRSRGQETAANRNDPRPASAGGSISGRVTDTSGVGIQNIKVFTQGSVNQYESGSWTGLTDASGNYTIFIDTETNLSVFFDRNGQDYVSEYYSDQVRVDPGSHTPNIDAQLADAGSISGQASDMSGVVIKNISVHVYSSDNRMTGAAYTDDSGNYIVSGLAVGNAKVKFSSSLDYLSQWYNNKSSFAAADPVAVAARATTPNVNAQLAAGGHISGRVTNAAGNGVLSIRVELFDLDDNNLRETRTDANGYYTLVGVPTGSFKVWFYNYYGSRTYCDEWYNNKASFISADPVAAVAGATTPNIDAQMTRGGTITGQVTDASGAGIDDVRVNVCDLEDSVVVFGWTEASGSYAIPFVLPGTYKIYFSHYYQDYVPKWYNDRSSFTAADQVTVTEGQTVANINARLTAAGRISGRVTDDSGVGIKDISVCAYELDDKDNRLRRGFTNSGGNYTITGLATGSSKVYFSEDTSVKKYIPEWYNNKKSFAAADPVAAVIGATTIINAELAPAIGNSTHVISPYGGESWLAGTVHQVAWSTTGTIANVKIDYSTDNGSTWASVAGNTANGGSYPWTVPNTPSSRCLVRISDAANAATSDASDAAFSILMNLDLQAERREIKAFSIVRQYGQIRFLAENPAGEVTRYYIMRRQGNGDFFLFKEIAPAELESNHFQMQDKFLERDVLYTYRVEGYNGAGQLLAISAEKTI